MIQGNMYEETEDKDNKLSAKEILLSLPGVNNNNYKQIINKVNNISQLCELSESDIISIIGNINGKKLYNFLNHRVL